MRLFGSLLLAAVLSAGLFFPKPAQALGWSGHRIVCQLAYDALTPTARRSVDSILAADPQFDTLADACVWADQIRSGRSDTGPWHYINTAPGDGTVTMADCPPEGCVVSALYRHYIALADQSIPAPAKLEALKFFAHWVGDVHQPMHVSISGNRGGNDFKAIWRDGSDTNLHRVWDRNLIDDHMAQSFPDLEEDNQWQAYAAMLADRVAEVPQAALELDFEAWANESFAILQRPEVRYMTATTDEELQLDTAYYEANQPVIEDRMVLAARRLADRINRALDEGMARTN